MKWDEGIRRDPLIEEIYKDALKKARVGWRYFNTLLEFPEDEKAEWYLSKAYDYLTSAYKTLLKNDLVNTKLAKEIEKTLVEIEANL